MSINSSTTSRVPALAIVTVVTSLALAVFFGVASVMVLSSGQPVPFLVLASLSIMFGFLVVNTAIHPHAR